VSSKDAPRIIGRLPKTDASVRGWMRSSIGGLRRSMTSSALIGCIDVAPEVPAAPSILQGWVFSTGAPIVGVLLFVDGKIHLAESGIDRPDVARNYGESFGVRYSGFQVQADLRQYEGREITLRAAAITGDGRTEIFYETTTNCSIQPQLYFHPLSSDVTTDEHFLTVSGVALMEEFVSSVEISLDGAFVERARLNAFATPEWAWSTMPASEIAAFTTMVDIRGCEAGTTHSLTARALDLEGNSTEVAELEFSVSPSFGVANLETILSREGFLPNERNRQPDGPLRVLVIAHHLGIGGGQLYLQELIRKLVQLVDVELFVAAEIDGVLRNELEAIGATVIVTGLCPLSDPFSYETFLRSIALEVSEFEPEMILANTVGATFGTDLASELNIPSILAIHESFAFDEWFIAARGNFSVHPYVRERFREGLSSASAVVFESRATQLMYADVVAESQSELIPYGIDVEELLAYSSSADSNDLRKSLGIPESALVFLCIGTYEARKSQAMLSSAFAIASKGRSDAVLILVGARDDAYSMAVKRHIDDLDVDGRIRAIHVVRDLRPWYAIADVLVSASDIESMPRSMMEAMAFGLPILAADAPGVSEIVENGVTGWLVPTRDVGALVGGIATVLETTAEQRVVMGEAAQMNVKSNHDSSGYAESFAELLQKVRD